MADNVEILIAGKDQASHAFASAGHAAKGFANELKQLGSHTLGLKEAIAGAVAGFTLFEGVKKSVELFIEHEHASRALSLALRLNGEDVGAALPKLEGFAVGLSRTTTESRDATLELLRYGASMGISANQLKGATQAAIGLAEALGIDQTEAMHNIAKAREGDFKSIQRQIPGMKALTTETEKLALLNEFAAKGFELFKERADETGGSLEMMKHTLEEVGIQIGEVLAPSLTSFAQGVSADLKLMSTDWTLTGDLMVTQMMIVASRTGDVFAAMFANMGATLAGALAAMNAQISNWSGALGVDKNGLNLWQQMQAGGAGLGAMFATKYSHFMRNEKSTVEEEREAGREAMSAYIKEHANTVLDPAAEFKKAFEGFSGTKMETAFADSAGTTALRERLNSLAEQLVEKAASGAGAGTFEGIKAGPHFGEEAKDIAAPRGRSAPSPFGLASRFLSTGIIADPGYETAKNTASMVKQQAEANKKLDRMQRNLEQMNAKVPNVVGAL